MGFLKELITWTNVLLVVFALGSVGAVVIAIYKEVSAEKKRGEERLQDAKDRAEEREKDAKIIAALQLEVSEAKKEVLQAKKDNEILSEKSTNALLAEQNKFYRKSMGEGSKPLMQFGTIDQAGRGSAYVFISNDSENDAVDLKGRFFFSTGTIENQPRGTDIPQQNIPAGGRSADVQFEIGDSGFITIEADFDTRSGAYHQTLMAVKEWKSWSVAYKLYDHKNKKIEYYVAQPFPYESLGVDKAEALKEWAKLQESGGK